MSDTQVQKKDRVKSTSVSTKKQADGKGSAGNKEGKKGSRQNKAGILFPVGRISRYLRERKYVTHRLSNGAPVFLAAVLEYMCAELLELAADACTQNNKKRIIPRHIQLAIQNDEELSKLLGDVVVRQGGVLPSIHSMLLPKRSGKPEKKPQSASAEQIDEQSSQTSSQVL